MSRPLQPRQTKRFRCAIYTRVSTDAGLDQDFNSLGAQREAAEAYIKSQSHEGWQRMPAIYDDGGFSGGSLDRPALQKLLADIKAGLIDIVLVYKVDRLTRSLADFAKLVELFDASNVSFVSVTQAFNTTNSMGRLTLNVLLSFAQFEREVTAERIRDKVLASKKNGIFMGGTVPLGYRVDNRKLVVVPKEAELIRRIFTRYLTLGSIIPLLAELRREGAVTRIRKLASGKIMGGVPFTAGPLLYLLKNRVYIGEISHRGQIYTGEHQAILDKASYDAVQSKLAENLVAGHSSGSSYAMLMGRIFDDRGNVMTPSHSQRKSLRYYYYVSRAFIEGRKDQAGSIPRVAAHDIEPKIITALKSVTRPEVPESEARPSQSDRQLIEDLVQRVTIGKDQIRIDLTQSSELADDQKYLEVPWKRKPGRPKREILFAQDDADSCQRPIKAKTRKSLIRAIALGKRWLQELTTGQMPDIESIAAREERSQRSIQMNLSLAFLAPDIVEAAVAGTLARGIGITKLIELPPLWSEQRKLLS